jgi:hypothetical protein
MVAIVTGFAPGLPNQAKAAVNWMAEFADANFRDNGTFANETSLTAKVARRLTPVIFARCPGMLRVSRCL